MFTITEEEKMSRRGYPRVVRERLMPQSKRDRNKRCLFTGCQVQATRRLSLETSWFRGEDHEVGYTCAHHGKKYRKDNSPNPDYLDDAKVLALTGEMP